MPGSNMWYRLLDNLQNMFLSAFLVVSGRWYYYCYLDEQNGIFENGEYQYLPEKGLVLLSFIPGR